MLKGLLALIKALISDIRAEILEKYLIYDRYEASKIENNRRHRDDV